SHDQCASHRVRDAAGHGADPAEKTSHHFSVRHSGQRACCMRDIAARVPANDNGPPDGAWDERSHLSGWNDMSSGSDLLDIWCHIGIFHSGGPVNSTYQDGLKLRTRPDVFTVSHGRIE